MRIHLTTCTVVMFLCLAMAGCEQDAGEHAKQGSVHLLQKKYPEAIASFEASLKQEPGNFEATVGLAEAYTEKGDHAKAQEYFDKVYAKNLDKGRQLYVDTKYQNLMLAKAEAMKDKKSSAYEAALREVIGKRKRGQAADKAYGLLGDYYIARGDALADDPQTRLEAAANYEKMRSVKTCLLYTSDAADE